jgi:citrate lyase beta subunit
MTRYLELGASLYVPATRDRLAAIGNREGPDRPRSIIFCTEDSVRARDLPRALDNLAGALGRLEPAGLLRFVRVRSPEVLRRVLAMPGVEQLTGLVFPKVTLANLDDYFGALPPDSRHRVMLTLETIEVFDPAAMAAMRDRLLQDRYRGRLLALRIGGNDLLNLLGLRRPRGRTVYETPLGVTIGQLVTTFRPHGLPLTAPVFEYLDQPDVLAREVESDLVYGLCGKAAIHPAQVPLIEAHYRVRPEDLRVARQILDESTEGVFRLNDAMCEPATHRAWAEQVVERANIYGVAGAESQRGRLLGLSP